MQWQLHGQPSLELVMTSKPRWEDEKGPQMKWPWPLTKQKFIQSANNAQKNSDQISELLPRWMGWKGLIKSDHWSVWGALRVFNKRVTQGQIILIPMIDNTHPINASYPSPDEGRSLSVQAAMVLEIHLISWIISAHLCHVSMELHLLFPSPSIYWYKQDLSWRSSAICFLCKSGNSRA